LAVEPQQGRWFLICTKGVRAVLLLQPLTQRELAGECPGQVASHDRGIRHPTEPGFDDERVDRHPGVGVDRRLSDIEQMQG
jgi:hypothetical protein